MKTRTEKQADFIRFMTCMVGAVLLCAVNVGYNAGYVGRWSSLAITVGILAVVLWWVRIKTFTIKRIDFMRFMIYILGAGLMYGVNRGYRADYIGRWGALAITVLLIAGTFWCARSRYWERLVQAE